MVGEGEPGGVARSDPGGGPGTGQRPSSARLTWQQVQYQNRIFFRTPIAAFFTIIFPLLLLVVFGAMFGNEPIDYLDITVAQYYAPALAVFAAASASYTNIGTGTAYQRDEGVLKRIHGTPLPTWIFFGGKVISATFVGAIAVTIMMTVGILFYGINLYPRTIPAAVLTFLVGVGCFAALGLLVAALAPSGPAATAITNATLIPLAFLSGVFVVGGPDTPQWITTIGNIFPLKHFNEAFQAAFDPALTGWQFDWFAIFYMALWGVAALILAIRLFKWEPTPRSGKRRKKAEAPA